MLCALYHDIKHTTSILLLFDNSIYLTHTLHIYLSFLMHLVTSLMIFHRYVQYIIP
jgi:hypothetical protein